ncbi:MAG: hypothetical protein K6F73_04235 [Lachnospiraceae bacterium]|nr:hypothetical protein [Lachnospiraceae bacterium]
MKRCYIAQAEDKIGTNAYPQILEQLTENGELIKPVLVLFTSDNANFGWYSRMLSNSFPDASVIGMTSDVFFSGKGTGRAGLSVLAVTSGISVSTGVLFEASRYPKHSSDSIIQAFEKIEKENTICLEFNASPGNCEELVMDTFAEIMDGADVPIFGASASTAENPDRPSSVSLNGILYMDACVFAFIHNENGRIGIIKENMFTPTEHFFTATDVDCDARKVYEFDHKSAAGVVASAMQIHEEELRTSSFFHPLGRMADGDMSVIAVRDQFPDGSMSFFSRIYNQTRVTLLKPIEPVEDVWESTASSVHGLIPDLSFAIIVNCVSRTRYFMETGKMRDFNDFLAKEYGDFIGFSGHGEQYDYRHLNQIMLIAAFE